MTRLTVPVFMATKPMKKFNNYRPLHPYRIWLPPVLKDHYKGSGQVMEKNIPCLDQMSNLFSCWNKHEFTPESCLTEVAKFQQCITDDAKATEELKAKMKDGKQKVRGSYNTAAVNKMLQKFKQPLHDLDPK